MNLGNRRGKLEFESLMFILGGGALVVFALVAYLFLFRNSGSEDPKPKEAQPQQTAVAPEKPQKQAVKNNASAGVPAGACVPGERQTEACNPGACSGAGTRSRFCDEKGVWEAWESCSGCSGTAERACDAKNGCPGIQVGECKDSCDVPKWGECRNDGVCSGGEKQCVDQKNYQVCVGDSCLWGKVIACPKGKVCQDGSCLDAKAVCKPGAQEKKSCNPGSCPQSGSSTRVCGPDGLWGIWSECAGCGGKECKGDTWFRECSASCEWSKPLPCGADENCSGGSCVASGAQFEKQEKPGPGGQLKYHPLRRKNGQPILTADALYDAYAAGEIIVYRDGKEIAVPQKPSSRVTSFTSTEFKEFAGGVFVAMSMADCKKIGGSLLNRPIRVATSSQEFSGYRGKVYTTILDYIENCEECWGAGPCFAPKGFDLAGRAPADAVKGWKWDVFTGSLVFGASAGKGEVAIGPVSGSLTGAGDLEISYYH